MAITDDKNTVTLPGVDFHELARQAISVQILKGFAAAPEVVTQVVAGALTTRVDSRGQLTHRDDYGSKPYLQFVTEDLIRKAALGALQQQVDAMKPAIQKALEAELKKAGPTIAAALVTTFAEQAKDRFKLDFAIDVKASSQR